MTHGTEGAMNGTVECVPRLAAELTDCVHLPGSAGYLESLGRVFFPTRRADIRHAS